jgi:hypothetical protein
MAQVLVRKLDDELMKRVKVSAARNGRSTEAEIRATLEMHYPPAPDGDIWEEMRRFRESLKPLKDSSVGIIRKMRRDAGLR